MVIMKDHSTLRFRQFDSPPLHCCALKATHTYASLACAATPSSRGISGALTLQIHHPTIGHSFFDEERGCLGIARVDFAFASDMSPHRRTREVTCTQETISFQPSKSNRPHTRRHSVLIRKDPWHHLTPDTEKQASVIAAKLNREPHTAKAHLVPIAVSLANQLHRQLNTKT